MGKKPTKSVKTFLLYPKVRKPRWLKNGSVVNVLGEGSTVFIVSKIAEDRVGLVDTERWGSHGWEPIGKLINLKEDCFAWIEQHQEKLETLSIKATFWKKFIAGRISTEQLNDALERLDEGAVYLGQK